MHSSLTDDIYVMAVLAEPAEDYEACRDTAPVPTLPTSCLLEPPQPPPGPIPDPTRPPPPPPVRLQSITRESSCLTLISKGVCLPLRHFERYHAL